MSHTWNWMRLKGDLWICDSQKCIGDGESETGGTDSAKPLKSSGIHTSQPLFHLLSIATCFFASQCHLDPLFTVARKETIIFLSEALSYRLPSLSGAVKWKIIDFSALRRKFFVFIS